eukprot:Hpha_TRINITY_DN3786_c0_g1::TRINITY_DN3786_c0_g1_i2::g.23782::m.23782
MFVIATVLAVHGAFLDKLELNQGVAHVPPLNCELEAEGGARNVCNARAVGRRRHAEIARSFHSVTSSAESRLLPRIFKEDGSQPEPPKPKPDPDIVRLDQETVTIYWATVGVGQPPQEISVVLDTGSTTAVIPSRECGAVGACVRSLTFPAGSTGPCYFMAGYADGTTYEGDLFVDTLSLGSIQARVRFGRILKSTAGVDYPGIPMLGIVGLAPPSHRGQCFTSGCADAAAFNLTGKHGGFTMRMGDSPPTFQMGAADDSFIPAGKFVSYTEISSDMRYYSVCMAAIHVEGVEIGSGVFNQSDAITVVDSGTSFLILPNQVVEAIVEELQKERCHIPGFCGKRSVFTDGWMWDTDFQQHKSRLPNIHFSLDGVRIAITPEEYMVSQTVQVSGKTHTYRAFGIQGWDGGVSILGDVVMRRFAVHFDPQTGIVSFNGSLVEKSQPHTCSVSPPTYVWWEAPGLLFVAAAGAGAGVFVLYVLAELLGFVAGFVAVTLAIAGLIMSFSSFWGPGRVTLERAVTGSAVSVATAMLTVAGCLLLLCLLRCLCRKKQTPASVKDSNDAEAEVESVAQPLNADEGQNYRSIR